KRGRLRGMRRRGMRHRGTAPRDNGPPDFERTNTMKSDLKAQPAPGDAAGTAGRSYPVIAESERWLARSTGLIPRHTQTLAKGPAQFVRGVAPMYIARGKGAHVWDVDGNEYIDLFMAVGPLSLGYCYDRVDDAIRRQLADGITFSMMHPLEVEVAE